MYRENTLKSDNVQYPSQAVEPIALYKTLRHLKGFIEAMARVRLLLGYWH